MSGRRGGRVLVGVLAASLLFAVALVPSAQTTEAAWTDSEHVGGSEFEAATLAPPQIFSTPTCRRLGNPRFTILWEWPSSAQLYEGFSPSNVQWRVGGTVPTTAPPTTGPDGNGRYTTTFTAGFLEGLIGAIFGVNILVEMRTTAGSNWQSANSSTVTYSTPLLTGAATCTIVNGPPS